MPEALRQLTALPNLHPAVVHFPIAFAIGALLVDLVSLFARRHVWLDRCAAVMAALAAVGAGGAYLAGRAAADSVGILAPAAEATLGRHSDLGLWALLVLSAAAIARVWASVRHGDNPVARVSPMRAMGMVLLAVGSGLVVVTADHGGALVFRHGVAVDAPSEGGSRAAGSRDDQANVDDGPAPQRGNAEDRMVATSGGGVEWRPTMGDAESLEQVVDVEVLAGDGVTPATDGRDGLWLSVDGVVALLLPGEFDNAVLEARLDITDFDGTIGLLHHASGAAGGTVFEVSTADGAARLVRRGNDQVLDSGEVRLPDGPVGLVSSSAAGHHQKGAVDGDVVVHGHASPGSGMRVGLLISGTGRLGIERMAVEPEHPAS